MQYILGLLSLRVQIVGNFFCLVTCYKLPAGDVLRFLLLRHLLIQHPQNYISKAVPGMLGDTQVNDPSPLTIYSTYLVSSLHSLEWLKVGFSNRLCCQKP